ncbi:hypothetical protein GGR50DRAFT_591915 [Xylaria sp. CBS 124048]|nr:hypothetical protein GGR50DRAFT_591915 [Xylaria sp. CBS 124048]
MSLWKKFADSLASAERDALTPDDIISGNNLSFEHISLDASPDGGEEPRPDERGVVNSADTEKPTGQESSISSVNARLGKECNESIIKAMNGVIDEYDDTALPVTRQGTFKRSYSNRPQRAYRDTVERVRKDDLIPHITKVASQATERMMKRLDEIITKRLDQEHNNVISKVAEYLMPKIESIVSQATEKAVNELKEVMTTQIEAKHADRFIYFAKGVLNDVRMLASQTTMEEFKKLSEEFTTCLEEEYSLTAKHRTLQNFTEIRECIAALRKENEELLAKVRDIAPLHSQSAASQTTEQDFAKLNEVVTAHLEKERGELMVKVTETLLPQIAYEQEHHLVTKVTEALLPQLQTAASRAAEREIDKFIEAAHGETVGEKMQAILVRVPELPPAALETLFLRRPVMADALRRVLARVEAEDAVNEWEDVRVLV